MATYAHCHPYIVNMCSRWKSLGDSRGGVWKSCWCDRMWCQTTAGWVTSWWRPCSTSCRSETEFQPSSVESCLSLFFPEDSTAPSGGKTQSLQLWCRAARTQEEEEDKQHARRPLTLTTGCLANILFIYDIFVTNFFYLFNRNNKWGPYSVSNWFSTTAVNYSKSVHVVI